MFINNCLFTVPYFSKYLLTTSQELITSQLSVILNNSIHIDFNFKILDKIESIFVREYPAGQPRKI